MVEQEEETFTMNLIFGAGGICMAFCGLFLNLYVIIVLVLNKKARTSSEWVLLHLSWCGLGTSCLNLCLISPSILMASWLTSTGSFCSIVGASVLTFQLLTVWSICALSVDRCAAIASPLRYTQLVTGRRVAVYFLIVWVLGIGTAMSAFIVSSVQVDNLSAYSEGNLFQTHSNNHDLSQIPITNLSATNPNYTGNSYYNPSSSLPSSTSTLAAAAGTNFGFRASSMPFGVGPDVEREINSGYSSSSAASLPSSSSPTVANMMFELASRKSSTGLARILRPAKFGSGDYTRDTVTTVNYSSTQLSSLASASSAEDHSDSSFFNTESNEGNPSIPSVDTSSDSTNGIRVITPKSEFRRCMGLCLPRVYFTSVSSVLWMFEWVFVILVAPVITILVCDLVVLSIARKQRHRIVMALYQITLSAQATVVRKGTTPPQLWLNRSIPARSRAVRAVFEDLLSLALIHLPLILILVWEMLSADHNAPSLLEFLGSLSLFLSPSCTALLYGIRARSLRAAYKSYIRKRMTNNTLQHEIQQRLSPVDGGSPRPSSGAKSFRSCTPSPASSPIQTPRRLSTNDLRPPPMHFPMNTGSSPVSPLPGPHTSTIINNDGTHFFMEHVNNHNNTLQPYNSHYDDGDTVSHQGDNGCLGGGNSNGKPRKIRSFLHLPSQHDMQEFWSGLRRPNRSPTIIITHEIRMKECNNSGYDSKSIVSSPTAEQRL